MSDSFTMLEKDRFLDVILDKLSVIIFDVNKTVVFANENICEVLGYTNQEIIGLQHQTFCFEEYAASPEYQSFWNSLLTDKKSFQDKIFRKTKQGSQLILEGIYFPILNQSNHTEYVMKIAFDISQREQTIRMINQGILDSSTSLFKTSRNGEDQISELVSNVSSIRKSSEKNQNDTQQLVQEINEIQKLLSSIDASAQKLKLLSFNTALEAARLENEATGFNVVTDEMKKLALQTRSLTDQILNKLFQVNDSIGSVSSGATTNMKNLDNIEESLERIKYSYTDLLDTSKVLEKNASLLSETDS